MRTAATFILIASLLACREEAPVLGAGTYVLTAINGKPLPYTWNNAGDQTTAGAIVLRRNHTSSHAETVVAFYPGFPPDTVRTVAEGTWTLTGAALDLAEYDGSIHVVGSLNSDNSVTLGIFRYEKR